MEKEKNKTSLPEPGKKPIYSLNSYIGKDKSIRAIIHLIQKIVKNKDVTVLILGETGTGKELLARIVHYESSGGDSPFIEVNCSAIPEHLLESELFGYEPGAFTDAKVRKKGLLEIAEGGTLFLDEIGLMSLNLQAKLLRVIEEKTFRHLGGTIKQKVSVRIIAATNVDLEKSIQEGTFREDLYYRLNMISIKIPPLRERIADTVEIAKFYVKSICKHYNIAQKKLPPTLLDKLLNYTWQGNVRELKNSIERAILLSEGPFLEEEYLFSNSTISHSKENVEQKDDGFLTIRISRNDMSLQSSEKALIQEILKITEGNKNKAARILKISRPRLVRKMLQYNL